MWILSIALAGGQQILTMHFKTQDSAELARASIRQARATPGCILAVVNDDYTRQSDIPLASILCVQMAEVAASSAADCEAQLKIAHNQAQMQIDASKDNVIRAARALGMPPGARLQ